MGPARAWFIAIVMILIGVAMLGAATTSVSVEEDPTAISAGATPGLNGTTTAPERDPSGRPVTTLLAPSVVDGPVDPGSTETTAVAPPFTFAVPADDPSSPTTLPKTHFKPTTTQTTTTTTTTPPPPPTVPGSDSADTVCAALAEVYRASVYITQPLDPANLRLSAPPYRASIVSLTIAVATSPAADLAAAKDGIVATMSAVAQLLSGVPTVDQMELAYRLMTDPNAPPPGSVSILAFYAHARDSCPALAAIIGQPPS